MDRNKIQTMIMGSVGLLILGLFILVPRANSCIAMNKAAKEAEKTGQIVIKNNSSEYKNKDYQDVKRSLESLGFENVNIEKIEDLITGWVTKDGSVEDVSIDGNTEFDSDDLFSPDAYIVIRYHTFSAGATVADNIVEEQWFSEDEQDDKTAGENNAENEKSYEYVGHKKSKDLFYTTNDTKAKAKKGATGKYAYKLDGLNYDIYYIIDFDKSRVFYFLEGEDNTFCDSFEIDYGNLNEGVFYTCHEDDSEWQNSVRFISPNAPFALIHTDDDGFETELYPVNIKDAQKLRNKKNITEK